MPKELPLATSAGQTGQKTKGMLTLLSNIRFPFSIKYILVHTVKEMIFKVGISSTRSNKYLEIVKTLL